MTSRHTLACAVAVVACAMAGTMMAARVGAEQAADDALAARLLKGAFDIHAHIDPDSFGPNSSQAARAIDVNDLAVLAKSKGMRGFVAKMHYDTTAHLVYVLRKAVPGIEIFGLVGSNRSMGGVNPMAVAHMAEVKGGWGRVVNMPTWDAEFFVKNGRTPNRPFVSVSKNGELLPEVKDVIAIMAKTKTRDSGGQMVLYTGHNAPAESLMMVREATKLGVPVMVSHPMIEFVNMPLAMMEEAAKLGAYLEIVSGWATGKEVEHETHKHVEAIRKIGVDRFILSSDRGQLNGPLHPDGLVIAAKALMKGGITEDEINRMLKDNPVKLFGLSAASTSTNGAALQAAGPVREAPLPATDIRMAEIDAVLKSPEGGGDRQIKVADMGTYNVGVGVLHRGAVKNDGKPVRGLSHTQVTEVYYILSGSGTLVTGGTMADTSPMASDAEVVRVAVGPSVNGTSRDGQTREVSAGDVVIIPQGVFHGWREVPDHVTYLSVRPDPDRVLPAGYVNPALKR